MAINRCISRERQLRSKDLCGQMFVYETMHGQRMELFRCRRGRLDGHLRCKGESEVSSGTLFAREQGSIVTGTWSLGCQ